MSGPPGSGTSDIVARRTTDAASAHARAEWARLRARLATVTPSALGRGFLAAAVLTTALWAAFATWPTLLPFALGGLIAYAALPLVDALDRLLPRAIASIVVMVGVVAAVVAVVMVVLPPLAASVVELVRVVPDASEIDDRVRALIASVPAESRELVAPILIGVAVALTDSLTNLPSIGEIAPTVLRAALGVAGAALGLVILPVWILTYMTDQARVRSAVDRALPGAIRTDVWAVARMLDRAAGTYLRGFAIIAVLVGLVTYIGLVGSPRVGGPTFGNPLALAAWAGATQLIPELGPIIGLLPVVLLLVVDPDRAVAYLAIYVVARLLVGSVFGRRLTERGSRVHPLVLIPGVVILGQVGPLALLLSGPILAFSSDLVRYVHGRLSEPPRPAGLLPGMTVQVTPVDRVPGVYRRSARLAPTAALAPTPAPATTATPATR